MSKDQKDLLEVPFSVEEIKDVIQENDSNKTPILSRNTIQKDLLACVNDF